MAAAADRSAGDRAGRLRRPVLRGRAAGAQEPRRVARLRHPLAIDLRRTVGTFTGAAGLNVPAYDGLATFMATPAGSEPVTIHVSVGGVDVRTDRLAPSEATWVRARWPARGLGFVEITATRPDGSPAQVQLTLRQP